MMHWAARLLTGSSVYVLWTEYHEIMSHDIINLARGFVIHVSVTRPSHANDPTLYELSYT